MKIDQFIKETNGRSFDIDHAYGVQCWDYFAKFVQMENLPISTYCRLTGYAGDLFKLRDQYGYSRYFDYIYSIKDLKDGDWVFWNKHVAIYYQGKQYGQNQSTKNRGVTAKKLNTTGFIGALRYRSWQPKTEGVATHYNKGFCESFKALYDVNLRSGGSVDYPVLKTIKAGDTVQCYGYYTVDIQKRIWYYVYVHGAVGFVCGQYVR